MNQWGLKVMTKEELFSLKADKPSEEIYKEAGKIWDSIAKPIDGLGDFERVVCQLCAVQNTLSIDIEKKILLVFCADNGIVEEGISQSPQSVTLEVTKSLSKEISSSNTLARSVGCEVWPVDMGINSDEMISNVIARKISKGSRNFLNEAAMTEEETLRAVEIGIELSKKCKEEGYKLIATGEMGIGNTTTATSIICALLSLDPASFTGRGAGLDDSGLERKKKVIRAGIEKYAPAYEKLPAKEKAFEILRCLGGYDIAAMTGVYIGCAIYKIPVLIDGLISAGAALVANSILEECKDYEIASHSGRENGLMVCLEALGKNALINGNMALGEGTGALMVMPLLDSSVFFYKNATRFSQTPIETYERFN